jgi:pyruvate,water dikinase
MAGVQEIDGRGSAGGLVCNFEHLARSDVALVGGKNSSLGEMISALETEGIAVPPGFATTSHVYKLLLETGKADVDLKDNDDQTPLSRATEEGHETVVKLLQFFCS